MNVVLATNHTYPPQRVGGAESSMHAICLELQRRGVATRVLARWAFRQPGALGYAWRSLPSPRHRLVRDRKFGYPVDRVRAPSDAVGALIADARPDVAIVNFGDPLAPAFSSRGVPTLVYVRDISFERLRESVRQEPMVRYVTTSCALAERFEAAFGIRPARIPPFVMPELYRVEPLRRAVVFVCPVRGKGLDVALRLATLRRDIPFLFVVSWPVALRDELARDLRIRAHANVVLRRSTQDMREVYRQARIVLAPSLWLEGWGRVVSEAQVSGIPALASDIGGLPEAVGPGGILVDPHAGVGTWAAALSRLWDDGSEYDRLSRLALAHARRRDFAPAHLADRLLAELAELMRAAGA